MSVPLIQALKIGSYLFRQKIKGNKRYPLVMMLEPLFRCNLECIGCGKIQTFADVQKNGPDPARPGSEMQKPSLFRPTQKELKNQKITLPSLQSYLQKRW